MPTSAYTRPGICGSNATDSTPRKPVWLSETKFVNGTQLPAASFQRNRPPTSVRAKNKFFSVRLGITADTKPPPPSATPLHLYGPVTGGPPALPAEPLDPAAPVEPETPLPPAPRPPAPLCAPPEPLAVPPEPPGAPPEAPCPAVPPPPDPPLGLPALAPPAVPLDVPALPPWLLPPPPWLPAEPPPLLLDPQPASAARSATGSTPRIGRRAYTDKKFIFEGTATLTRVRARARKSKSAQSSQTGADTQRAHCELSSSLPESLHETASLLLLLQRRS